MNRRGSDFHERYGPWALVTGAAQGLGEEFTRQCAQRGLNVVGVDRQEGRLDRLCRGIEATFGVSTLALTVDLALCESRERLVEATDGLEIGLVVSNAGRSTIDRFLDIPRSVLDEELEVNARATMWLAHRFAPAMVERGRGGLVTLSSMSAITSTGYATHYVATKAYNRALAEGMWAELGPRGVDVLALLPGITETPAWYASGPSEAVQVKTMPCSQVVSEALEALGRRPSHIPGAGNRLASLVLGRLLPRAAAIRLVSRTMERIYGL